MIEVSLEALAAEQRNMAVVRAEAMSQSSETWHDNAPADAANLEASRVTSAAKALVRLLGTPIIDYPPEASPIIEIGSFVLLDIWGMRVGAAVVGASQIYQESDLAGVEGTDENMFVGVNSALGLAILGRSAGNQGSYEAADQTFTFTVLGIDQKLIKDHFASPVPQV